MTSNVLCSYSLLGVGALRHNVDAIVSFVRKLAEPTTAVASRTFS